MMKRMNRRISTIACAVAVLIWTCAPMQAKTFGKCVRTGAGPVEENVTEDTTFVFEIVDAP
jgi:hypothetical protein